MSEHLALAPEFVQRIKQLETELKLPVWLLIQDAPLDREQYGKDTIHMIGDVLTSEFFAARHSTLQQDQRIALLVDSHGGSARSAYELAMLLRRHCGGFTAIIPRHAKSAATLLTLGAGSIIMNANAELGPLDVQVWDPDREDMLSGLDEVQSLERLHAFAMEAFDKLMLMLLDRTWQESQVSHAADERVRFEVGSPDVRENRRGPFHSNVPRRSRSQKNTVNVSWRTFTVRVPRESHSAWCKITQSTGFRSIPKRPRRLASNLRRLVPRSGGSLKRSPFTCRM
jgi:hypothetical protein